MKKQKILTYKDAASVPAGMSHESLVDVRAYDPRIMAVYEKSDMIPYTGQDVFVRRALAKKLANVNALLLKECELRLKIVYGYRHPEIQERYFQKRRAELAGQAGDVTDLELDELTHNFVAVPAIAGHPTGGAVDVTLVNRQGDEIDMGTAIADYADPDKIRTFSNKCTIQQKDSRRILLDAMTSQGFAPFYGEWWHFSYGDREWAAFYSEPAALYGVVDERIPITVLTSAGGNATAIQVIRRPYPRAVYADAGKRLIEMSRRYNGEQAGFLLSGEARFEMAGGEFCGNATSAAAVMMSLLTGSARIKLSVSGIEGAVMSVVCAIKDDRYRVKSVFSGLRYVITRQSVDGVPVTVVDLGGIVHVLVDDDLPDNYESIHRNLTIRLGLSKRSAVGVIWIKRLPESVVAINPVVWVNAADTFFYETSCGSGSIAAAIAMNRFVVRQPTGQTINISITRGGIALETEIRVAGVL